MTVRDYLTSLVRTVVPALVGLALAHLTKLGLDVDPGVVSGLLDVVLIGGYYTAVRKLESRWPAVGVLLGWKAQPKYDA